MKTLSDDPMGAVTILVVGALIFAVLMLAWAVHDDCQSEEVRGWRIRCVVAGRWAYEEKHGVGWTGITLEELGDYRESPHVIAIPASPNLPDWAATRRSEIVARLQSELKRPDYVLRGRLKRWSAL